MADYNMNAKIESFYPKIGQLFFNILPNDFVEAWFNIEMIDDVQCYGAFFLDTHGKTICKIYELDDIVALFSDMRNEFKKSGKEPFSNATFWLTSAGKFSIDFGYEDVSDFGLASERRNKWMKKYLRPDSEIIWPKCPA